MEVLLSVAIVLFAGIFCNIVTKKWNLPTVIGYLLIGILIGPYCLGFIQLEDLRTLEMFTPIALAFISFSIGSEFRIKFIKKLGIKPLIVALTSSLFTLFLVTVSLLWIGCDFSFSILLGAIAASTAPPAIMMIIKEYKARGELTDMILSVIALDDVISILAFGFVIVLAEKMNTPHIDFLSWLEPFREIILSLLLGSMVGLILGRIERKLKSEIDVAISIVAFIFLMVGLCEYLGISPLLMSMVMGFTFVNTVPVKMTNHIMKLTDLITPPLFMVFFVVSGAELNFALIPELGLIGVVFILSRTIGKIVGATIGAKCSHCSPKIVKYLGPTLLSETGIALGLALMATETVPAIGEELQLVVIASSFIFDLTGPFIVKYCMKKAGEIEPKKKRLFFKRQTS